jgi:arginine/ornithine N-succinyltransferase beta subunit
MSKIIYSTSATILYLLHIEKISMREIRRVINEPLRVLNKLKSGKEKFTKQNYLDIISKYPTLEGKIEMFENVKLKDK